MHDTINENDSERNHFIINSFRKEINGYRMLFIMTAGKRIDCSVEREWLKKETIRHMNS